MTHFTVAIIIPPHINDVKDFIATQMRPFDENLEVAPYVCYSIEQAAIDLAEAIHRFDLIVNSNDPIYRLETCKRSLTQLRQVTPEQHYQERVRYSQRVNEQGQPLSTRNLDFKWDQYVIGGRWDGWIHDRECEGEYLCDNIASVEHLIAAGKIPHAIITPDGQWHERGCMGRFGKMLTENEGWDEQARELFAANRGHRVVIVDARI